MQIHLRCIKIIMDLQQIQVNYQADQDRLLVKFSFSAAESGRQEIRAYLTRALILRLWPATMEAMATQVGLNRPAAAHASHAIVQMEHQASVSEMVANGGFSTPYENAVLGWPLGETPLLLESVKFHLQADLPPRMEFAPYAGNGFEINLEQSILHAFCKLLQDAVQEADWGFSVEMPGTLAEVPAPAFLN